MMLRLEATQMVCLSYRQMRWTHLKTQEKGDKVCHLHPRPATKGIKGSPLLRKRNSGNLFTNTFALLKENKDNRGKKFDESKHHNLSLEHHNQFLETVEDRKLALEEKKLEFMLKQTKNEELNYRANLVEKYHEWKDRGMTDKQILCISPDLKVVVDALNGDLDDDS